MSERLPEFDPEQHKRQLRRRMLVLARLQGANHEGRWVPGRNFLVARDDQGNAVRDEAEATELLSDLIAEQLIEEYQTLGVGSGSRAFAQRRFRITNRGYDLWAEKLDPIPSIADARWGDT